MVVKIKCEFEFVWHFAPFCHHLTFVAISLSLAKEIFYLTLQLNKKVNSCYQPPKFMTLSFATTMSDVSLCVWILKVPLASDDENLWFLTQVKVRKTKHLIFFFFHLGAVVKQEIKTFNCYKKSNTDLIVIIAKDCLFQIFGSI